MAAAEDTAHARTCWHADPNGIPLLLRPEEALEYARRLQAAKAEFPGLVIVMRAYFEVHESRLCRVACW